MTDEKMPTREEVREWLNSGEWGGEGIEPLIDNACEVGVAYLALLDERDQLIALKKRYALTAGDRARREYDVQQENKRLLARNENLEAVLEAANKYLCVPSEPGDWSNELQKARVALSGAIAAAKEEF